MMDGRRDPREPATDADSSANVEAPGPDGVAQSPDLRGRRRSPWNPATWSPATSSFAPNPTFRRPRPRRFASTEHLAPEAVAAFVDGELGMTAHVRATHHLALCRECMDAVDAQLDARTRLRDSGTVAMPANLLGQLSQIPTREIDMTGAHDRREAGRRPSPFPGGRSHGPLAAPGALSASGMPPAPSPVTAPRPAPNPVKASGDAVDGEAVRGRRNRWRGR